MFQFLFKYPIPVFTKGRFVLLGAWPAWLLPVLILASAGGLAALLRWRMRNSEAKLQAGRAGAVWSMQSALVALLLLLLWQPAMIVGELSSRQNIIAVVVDGSRSMSIADGNGKTRETAAIAALNGGVLAALKDRFHILIYRLGSGLAQVTTPDEITPTDAATHIGQGLEQLAKETQDLPVGAIVLLSDGSQNSAGIGSSGIGSDALQALKERRLPVHTIGFGETEHAHDVEMEDVGVAASAAVNARIATTVTLVQHGYAGHEATLDVRDGDKTLAQRKITLAADGQLQTEPLFFPAGSAGAKSLTFAVEPLPGDEEGQDEAGFGWRTKVQFAVRGDGLAGLRGHRSHEVIDVGDCLIAHPAIRDLGIPRLPWPGASGVEADLGGDGERAVIVSESRVRGDRSAARTF